MRPDISAVLVMALLGIGSWRLGIDQHQASVREARHLQIAHLEVTHRDLITTCVNGTPTDRRRWDIGTTEEQALVFTMAAAPATRGTSPSDPGHALVRFVPQAGHHYEVEVRTERPELYGTRRWERGEWKPVVRDRTIERGPDADDRIVSGDPEWIDRACP
jgi:hypothetical protein